MVGATLRRVVGIGLVVVLGGAMTLVAPAGAQEEPAPPDATTTTTTTTAPTEGADLPPEVGPQVIGGSNASVTNYPWMAALLDEPGTDAFDDQFCGGALVDPLFVLTTADCVWDFQADTEIDPADVSVALGFSTLSTIPNTTAARRPVVEIITDPAFDRVTFEHDVALLQLATPANGIPTLAYANEPSTEQTGQGGTVLGWGAKAVIGGFPADFADTLQSAPATVLSPPGDATCGTYDEWEPGADPVFFTATQICAGTSMTGGSPDACVVDEGGPLVVGNPGGYKVIGLVNFAGCAGQEPVGCPCHGNPSIYSRVSALKDFIDLSLTVAQAPATYHPIDPFRLVDTRNNTGGLASGTVGPQWTINPQVTQVPGAIVPSPQAVAVVLNVTATGPSANGWLTVFPTGTQLPTASNLNFAPGQTVANLVTVQLGQGGKVSINNTGGNASAGSLNIIVDVVGWYSNDDTGGFLQSVSPARVLDTRFGTPANPSLSQPVVNGTPIAPKVCGPNTPLPPDASAAIVNTTVVGGATPGWLTVWPSGPTAPTASNLNYGPGQAVPNLVIAKIDQATCTVQVGNSPGTTGVAPVNVIMDVVGWYGQPGADDGARFHPMAPNRIVDTRFGVLNSPPIGGPLAADQTISPRVNLAPAGTEPAAVILNVTATDPSRAGWLTVFPDAGVPPTASNLNFVAGQTVPNLVIVQVGDQFRVQINNSHGLAGAGTVHVIVDQMGWFE